MAVLRIALVVTGVTLLVLSAVLAAARPAETEPPFTVSTRFAPGGMYIYLQRRDTGELIPISTLGNEYRSPVWSPDGDWIIYTNYSLYRMRPTGREVQRLTTTLDGSPSWSPDGAYVVFQSYVAGNWDIYRLHLQSGERIRLTDAPADDAAPVWSPRGDWIAFTSLRDGHWDIYRMRPDGSEVTNLSNVSNNVFSPMWSPDGEYIGFFYNSVSVKRITHLMRADGTGWEILWNRDLAPEWELATLPDFDLPWRGFLPAVVGIGSVLMGARIGKRPLITSLIKSSFDAKDRGIASK